MRTLISYEGFAYKIADAKTVDLTEDYRNQYVNAEDKVKVDIIENRYTISAMRGGGYNGEEPYLELENPTREEKRFVALQNVLEIFAKNITFLNYQKLEELIQDFEIVTYEYYGNSYTEAVQVIELTALYAALVEMDYLEVP